jgi:hypothetical protein
MTTVVEAVNATLASPRAEAAVHVGAQVASGFVARILDGMNVWTVLLTLFLGAVLYDQCEFVVFFEGRGGLFSYSPIDLVVSYSREFKSWRDSTI